MSDIIERQEFERYFAASRKSRGAARRPTFARLPDGTYEDDHTQRHWWTWQQAQARLRSELEEARLDAARWRWLREQHAYDGEGDSDIARWYVQAGREPVPCDPGALDDQIDAAIAAQGADHE